eukprot:gene10241-biopygen19791
MSPRRRRPTRHAPGAFGAWPAPPEPPRIPGSAVSPALVSRRSWRAGPVPAPLWKDRTPIFPKRCWNRSDTPRTATDQRRRNRAPGDPGDPRGCGGAGQAPKVPDPWSLAGAYRCVPPSAGAAGRQRWRAAAAGGNRRRRRRAVGCWRRRREDPRDRVRSVFIQREQE